VNENVEHASLGLLAGKRLSAAGCGERTNAVQIPSRDCEARSGGGQSECGPARGASISHHQDGTLANPDMTL
jgi:hypothetical protein